MQGGEPVKKVRWRRVAGPVALATGLLVTILFGGLSQLSCLCRLEAGTSSPWGWPIPLEYQTGWVLVVLVVALFAAIVGILFRNRTTGGVRPLALFSAAFGLDASVAVYLLAIQFGGSPGTPFLASPGMFLVAQGMVVIGYGLTLLQLTGKRFLDYGPPSSAGAAP